MNEDLKKIVIAKTLGARTKPDGSIDEVKQQTEHMSAIEKAMDTARKLAGTEVLGEELKRKEAKVSEIEREKAKTDKELQEAKLQIIQADLGGKIDKLSEAIKIGASPKSIGDQITEIKKAAGELGLGTSKISEFKEVAELIKSFNPQRGLAEQVKDAKDLIAIIQPPKPEGSIEGMPASIAVQLEKMRNDLKIKLEEMADARQERAENFTITVKKWDEERDMKRLEIESKLGIEKERNEMIAGGMETIGRAIGKGYAESMGGAAAPSETITQKGPKSFHIAADEGASGTAECPNCHSPMGVGPTSTETQCVGCGGHFPIVRTPSVKSADEVKTPEETK